MKIQNTRLVATAAIEPALYSTLFVILLGVSALSLIMSFSLLAGAVYIH